MVHDYILLVSTRPPRLLSLFPLRCDLVKRLHVDLYRCQGTWLAPQKN